LVWAGELAAGPLVAHGLAKSAVDGGLGRPLADGLAYELEAFSAVFETEDARTGLRSFVERGPGRASFSGR
jgi:enoyl-CoA hydratase/carnithine racemase